MRLTDKIVSRLTLFLVIALPALAGVRDDTHIILISVDGLRPDAIGQIKAPNFNYLLKKGTYFKNAQTIERSETLPSHTSMITGVSEYKHGIDWNYYKFWRQLEVPTCFELAKNRGLHTAMFVGKDKLRHLNRPNSLDYFMLTGDAMLTVSSFGNYIMKKGLPNLTLLHFKDPDEVGHEKGWMSVDYMKAVERVDAALGTLTTLLRANNLEDSTYVILTGDHGGHGFGHYPERIVKNLNIIWLANGPGVGVGLELLSRVKTYDTAATILSLLQIEIPSSYDGRALPIKESTNWQLLDLPTEKEGYSWCIHPTKPHFNFLMPTGRAKTLRVD